MEKNESKSAFYDTLCSKLYANAVEYIQ